MGETKIFQEEDVWIGLSWWIVCKTGCAKAENGISKISFSAIKECQDTLWIFLGRKRDDQVNHR